MGFEREPLAAPFRFKAGSLTELWQTVVRLESGSGTEAVGLGVQSVLWSDARVFAAHTETEANNLMFRTTREAARRAESATFGTPFELFDALFTPTFEFAKHITGRPDLRPTFALNALVPLDNAAWVLYAREEGFTSFDDMLPAKQMAALPCRHDALLDVPLFTYGTSLNAIEQSVRDGAAVIKIKIGADPDGDGDRAKTLSWDCNRLSAIHGRVGQVGTPYTRSGHVLYYLDANGRYDSHERLVRLLDHAERIGALERIVMIEEPFPEDLPVDVHDVPVPVAADESLHSLKEADERLDLGYRFLTLKPIAKTLSLSLRLAELARQQQAPCFCADLTVNPVLVDWNKCVAARLPALPGIDLGIIEANGPQNYRNWGTMLGYHPEGDRSWAASRAGVFRLDDSFYAENGGILRTPHHYGELLRRSSA